MGCISGADASKGSTPRAAVTVITEIKEPIRKKARVSARGDSFIVYLLRIFNWFAVRLIRLSLE
jgi:hypothetical protein